MNRTIKYKNVIARTQRYFYPPKFGGIARTFGGFECAILEVTAQVLAYFEGFFLDSGTPLKLSVG